MLRRRSFLYSAVLATMIAPVHTANSYAAEQQKISVQLAWLPDSGSAGEIVALKKGFFSQHGLDVTLLPGGPSANPIQELLGGTSDIAVAYAPQIMYSAARGLPITSIAATFQKAPLTYFSLAESNIKSVKDWKGKRIGGAQDAIPQVKAILKHNGLSFDDITYVQAQVPALMQRQVDAIGAWPTNVSALQPVLTNAAGYNTQSVWDNGLQFQSNYYVVRKDALKAKASALKAFLEAVDEGWSFAADNPGETVKLLVDYAPTLEADKQLASLKVITKDFIYSDETKKYGFANVSSDRWQQTLDTYAALGEIPSTVQAADVFDGSVLAAAKRTKR